MKTLFTLSLLILFFTVGFCQENEKYNVKLFNGTVFQCMIVSADQEGISVLSESGNVNKIDAGVIASINNANYYDFLLDYTQERKTQKLMLMDKTFGGILDNGGTLIAAGAGLWLGGSGLVVFAALQDNPRPVFYYISGGASLVGTIMLMAGGLNISKAGRMYKQQLLGAEGRVKMEYGLLGSGAGVRLRL